MDVLRDEHVSWFELGDTMRMHALVNRIPLIGGFEITSRCNLKCPMCYIRHDDTAVTLNKELSAQNWIDLGRQVFDSGTVHLLITGGEPLIRKDFMHIYEELSLMGFVITLYTNGTLIDKEFINWIKRIPPSKIGITLYGSSTDVYERVTGNGNAYERVRDSIKMIMDAGIPLSLRSTITKRNLDDVKGMEKFAEKFNVPVNFVYNVISPVRGAAGNIDCRLDPDAVCSATVDRIPVNAVVGSKKGEGMFCTAGRCSYWVSWDGYLMPCAFFDDKDKSVTEKRFRVLWEVMNEQVDTIMSPPDCLVCEAKDYCSVCPGRLKAETGSWEMLSKYICEIGRSIYAHFDKSKLT